MARKVKQKDFESLIKENIKTMLAQRKRTNKINDYKNYLTDDFVLGSGTFGKIYSVKDHNGKLLALKQ